MVNFIKLLFCILVLVTVIAIVFTPPTSNNPQTKIFNNKYVEFTYPANWTVIDQSINGVISIQIFNGTPTTKDKLDPNWVGEIQTVDSNYPNTIPDTYTILTIHNMTIFIYQNYTSGDAKAFYPTKHGTPILFNLVTNNEQEQTFDNITGSLKIK